MNCYAVISRICHLVKEAKHKRESIVCLLLCKEEWEIRKYEFICNSLAERNAGRINQKLTRLVTFREWVGMGQRRRWGKNGVGETWWGGYRVGAMGARNATFLRIPWSMDLTFEPC